MDYREVSGGREFLLTLSYGADWREEIEAFAAEKSVEAAWFVGTGAFEDADLQYFDQDAFAFETVSFEEPLEVAACVGSVSLRDGDPIADAHVTLSRPSGQAIAGRLDRGTVFTGECYLRTFEEPLERERSETTGRDGWAV
ncbi:MAG: PPC domain-containing DNA-binding protein [Halobacteriota archaeon]